MERHGYSENGIDCDDASYCLISDFRNDAVSPVRFWTQSPPLTRWGVLTLWLATILIGTWLGIASINWSGIPISIAGIELHITLYPPLILALLWTIWFGFFWGFIPAFISTLFLALDSGMALHWSVLFAFSDPIGLAVFGIAFRGRLVPRHLRAQGAVMVMVMLAFIAAILSSSGSFVWIYTNGIGVHNVEAIWQGWWLGAFLQNSFVVLPVAYLLGPLFFRWRNRFDWTSSAAKSGPYSVIWLGIAVMVAVAVFLLVSLELSSRSLAGVVNSDSVTERAALLLDFSQSIDAYLQIIIIVISFAMIFGYQTFEFLTRNLRSTTQKLGEANTQLEQLARTDFLTELNNRRYFMGRSNSELQRALRHHHALSVVLMDIDHFKQVNDRYGHSAGDAVLVDIAQLIQRESREIDISARYGGEEFVMLLPETDQEQALELAERLRQAIAGNSVDYEGQYIRVTVSLGVASLEPDEASIEAMLNRADKALYRAKEAGRNRVMSLPENEIGRVTE